MIERPLYLDRLNDWKDTDTIKVITGIRRCGKSKLLESFAEQLKKSGVPKECIVQFNFEDLDNIMDYQELHKTIDNILKKNKSKKTYIFLDEIQQVPNWEKTIASLRLRKNADLYLTGSNAYMLSSELATHLSGRYVEIKMLPLSFKEFLTFYTFPKDMLIDKKFTLYMKFGGMPSLQSCNFNEKKTSETLEGIFNTVLIKDVAGRSENKNISVLTKIAHFLADNIANMTSINTITNTLYSEKAIEKKNNTMVEEDISLLEKSFIFYPIKRYDIKGKEYLKTLQKYYIVDSGIRHHIIKKLSDTGRLIENIVYFELLRRGYTVAIGKVGKAEIDFVATKDDDKIYVQITESMLEEKTRERELSALRNVKDNYPKIVLTADNLSVGTTDDGIKIINLIDWLLDE